MNVAISPPETTKLLGLILTQRQQLPRVDTEKGLSDWISRW